jgi:RNA polymerase-binding transcription factor DksA
MSKKTHAKAKPVSKTKGKAKPAAKAPQKKAKPVAKKPAAKNIKPKPKAAAKTAVKSKPKAAPKAKAKVVSKAKPAAKTVQPPVKTKAPVSKKENEKTKASQPVAKPEQKEDTSKVTPPQNRPSVGRPMPVNRRPEPARAIINSKPKEAESSKNRYADNELEEFREIINSKLENARKELALLQQQMTSANEHGTDDTASTFKILEDGSDSLAKEEAGQLASRQKKFIEQLENALVRIENKTYGICRVTGKLIPKERLRAVPHTTQSIEAKLNQYRD